MECHKIRNPNPFTERQIRLLEAIREKIRQIDDPDPDIITHESYDWFIESTRQFGRIPKIRFHPKSCQIKAELIEKAGLVDEARQEQISQIRRKYGIRKARNGLANLFESEWNNIMLKFKKATFVAAYINQLFATDQQTIAEPMQLLQSVVMDEYSKQIKAKKDIIHSKEKLESQENKRVRSYEEELMEVE